MSDGEASASYRPRDPSAPPPGLRGQLAIAVLCLGAVAVFAFFVDHVYPVGTWLAWRTLAVWMWVVVLHAACLGLGARIAIDWLRVDDRPALETLTLSFAVGVVGWILILYLLGALGLYGKALVFVLPPPLVWAGIGPLRGSIARWRDRGDGAPRPSALPVAVAAFGVLCLGLMYLQLFSPDALNYDSTWCHLTVAQDYAREGRIVAFPADYAKNVPQLTPMFHLFGFLAPGLNQPLRWMFALHNEFALFLWTLVGVAAAVRWIVGEDGPHGPVSTWAAFFLFPGIFVYDSNLGGAADHVLAFFALPVVLATARLGARPTRHNAVLWGVVVGGALLVKYQAVYFVFPALAVLASLWLLRGRRLARDFGVAEPEPLGRLARTAAIAVLAVAVVVAPHFLRNLVFHKNPFYPFMQGVFSASTPRTPDGAFLVSHVFTDVNWQPKGTLVEKLVGAVKLFFQFSFIPHYYYEFHHNVPSFGSLFTLLLPVVPFLGRRPRLWAVVGVGSASILLWALTFLVDRNLQTFLPILVAATAAVIVLAWRAGPLARLGLVPLVALQLIWGGDAFFHSGYDRLRSAVDLIRSGYAGGASTRFAGYRTSYVKLGEALPRDATVLLHASHVNLGINRRVLLDWAGFQAMFDYRRVRSVAELDALYRSAGVTHIVRELGLRPAATKQEELLFALYLRHATPLGTFGGLELLALPAVPPKAAASDRVVMAGVRGYEDGVYAIDQLGAYENLLDVAPVFPRPRTPLGADPAAWPAIVRDSMAVVVGNTGPVPPQLLTVLGAEGRVGSSAAGGLTVYAPPR